MGKLSVVQFGGSDITLSMIRWGILRRYRSNKFGFMNLTGALFIPKYEIAVYDGEPSVKYKLGLPDMVFYYPDKSTALQKFDELRAVITQGGLFGKPIRDFISSAEPKEQHNWLVAPNLESNTHGDDNPELECLAQLERLAEFLAQTLPERKKPQGLTRMAVMGAETRCQLVDVIEKFEAETGRSVFLLTDTAEGVVRMFVDRELNELIQKSPYGELLHLALFTAFPTLDRQITENWSAIVETYHAQPTTKDLLFEKADRLSHYIILKLDIAPRLYTVLYENGPELSDEQRQLVKLEEAAVWFRVIDEMAHWCFRSKRPFFMDYFEDALAYHLAMQGASPDAISTTIEDRMNEYGPYRKWVSGGDEPAAGTLLWEAGKHLQAALGVGRHALFQVYFADWFLKSVKERPWFPSF